MFTFLLATVVAVSSVSVDGIFGKRSCNGTSCSAPVAAKPVAEKKVEVKATTSDAKKSRGHFKLFASRKGCKS